MPGSKLGGVSILKIALRAPLYAALYFAMMVSAIMATRFGGQVSPIWLASGVLAWALISSVPRDWPWLVGAAALAHILGALFVNDQWSIEFTYLVANMASPLVFAALVHWRHGSLEFEDRRSVLNLLLYSVIAAAASSLVVVAGAAIGARPYPTSDLLVWFLSDGLAFAVFVPIIMVMARGDWRDLLAPPLRARTASLFIGLFVLLTLAWTVPSASVFRILLLLLIPFLIYVAFDLGVTAARAAVAIAAVALLTYTLFGSKPLDRELDAREFVVAMQIYVAVLFVAVMPLAAALAEKQRLYEHASSALSDAQAAWGELLAAEAHYRFIADNAQELIVRLALDGTVLFVSPAWRTLTEDPEALTGTALADLAAPEDRSGVQAGIAAAVREGALDHPHQVRLRLRDTAGVWRPFDAQITLVAPGGGDPGELIAVLRQAQT